MSEILSVQFSPDGEWLGIGPYDNPDSGPALHVEPSGDDFQQALDVTRQISPGGFFRFLMHADHPYENWHMELYGLPRIAGRLDYDRLEAVMGEEAGAQVRLIAEETAPNRESVGDLMALDFAASGKPWQKAIESFSIVRLVEAPNLNNRTEQARRSLLEMGVPKRRDKDRLFIPKSVLIAP